MSIKVLLGLRIKEVRIKNRLTQAQLAEAVGIDPKHQSCIETGRNFPSADLLDKYAKVFDIDVCTLLHIEHNQTKSTLKEKLFNMIDKCSEDDFIMIYKIVTSILR